MTDPQNTIEQIVSLLLSLDLPDDHELRSTTEQEVTITVTSRKGMDVSNSHRGVRKVFEVSVANYTPPAQTGGFIDPEPD